MLNVKHFISQHSN